MLVTKRTPPQKRECLERMRVLKKFDGKNEGHWLHRIRYFTLRISICPSLPSPFLHWTERNSSMFYELSVPVCVYSCCRHNFTQFYTFLLFFILSYKRVLCHAHTLLCLCRLCLSRRACTWVAYVNFNNKHDHDDDDDDRFISLIHRVYCCSCAERVCIQAMHCIMHNT